MFPVLTAESLLVPASTKRPDYANVATAVDDDAGVDGDVPRRPVRPSVVSRADEGDEEDARGIPEDTFSMVYRAETWSQRAFPLSVFFFQVFILCLVVASLLKDNVDSQRNTPLRSTVPVDVSTSGEIFCVDVNKHLFVVL